MILTEKQKNLVQDLQSQEELCIKKYDLYSQNAKDPELKNLFGRLKGEEQKHYDALNQLMNGSVSDLTSGNGSQNKYDPKATYDSMSNTQDKEYDNFLCTDSISMEKYVSGSYNDDLFQFAEANVRDLLNTIQTQEQNHAEQIYKYRSVNGMTSS